MKASIIGMVFAISLLAIGIGAATQTYQVRGDPCGVAGTTLAQDWSKYNIGDNKIISDLKTSTFFNVSQDVPDNRLVDIIVPRLRITQLETKTTKNVTITSSTRAVNAWEETQPRSVCGNCNAVAYSFVQVPYESTITSRPALFSSTSSSTFENVSVRDDYRAQVWSNGTKKRITQYETDKEVLVTERIDNRSRMFYQGLPFTCNVNTNIKVKESGCKWGQPNEFGKCETQYGRSALDCGDVNHRGECTEN